MFTPRERRAGWRFALLDASIQGVISPLLSAASPYLVPFALFLGASAWEVGILWAIGPLAMVVAATLERGPYSRKAIAVWGGAGSKYIWLGIAALPLLPLGGHWPVLAFLSLYALSAVMAQAGALAWLDWIRDLIEPECRGRFFASRNVLATLLTLLTLWLAGGWLDGRRILGDERDGFVVLILVGVAAALLNRWALQQQPDRPSEHATIVPVEAPTAKWYDFLGFFGVWTLAAGLAAPFYSAYALQSLHMSYQQLASWIMLGNVTGLVFQPIWGRLIDRGARLPVMLGCALIVALMPTLWLLARPDHLGYVWLDGLFNGIAWSGFNLSLTHLMLQHCPNGNHRRGLGLYTAIAGVSSGASALLGGWLVSHGPALPLSGPPLLFLLTSIGRFGCWIWLVSLIHRWEAAPVPQTGVSSASVA